MSHGGNYGTPLLGINILMRLNARCKEEDVVGGVRSRAEIAKPQLCGTTEIHLYHGNLDTRRNVTIIIAGSARDVVWSFTLIDSLRVDAFGK